MVGVSAGQAIDAVWVRDLIADVGHPVQLRDFNTPEGNYIPGPATEEQAVVWLTDKLQSINEIHWATRGKFQSSSDEVKKLANDVSVHLRKVLTKIGYDPERPESLIDPRFVFAGIYGIPPRTQGMAHERVDASVFGLAELQIWFERLAKQLKTSDADLRKSKANEWEQELRLNLASCYRIFWRRKSEFSRNSQSNALEGPFLRFIRPALSRISGRSQSDEAIRKAFQRERT